MRRPERTTLAWQRTGLGVVVGCFLIFHTAFQLGVLPVGVVAGGCWALGVAALAVFARPAAALPGGAAGGLVAAAEHGHRGGCPAGRCSVRSPAP